MSWTGAEKVSFLDGGIAVASCAGDHLGLWLGPCLRSLHVLVHMTHLLSAGVDVATAAPAAAAAAAAAVDSGGGSQAAAETEQKHNPV